MRKDFLYFLSPNVIGAAINFMLLPVLTLYLTPYDYGIVAAVTVVTGVISALGETGAGWVLSAYYHKDREFSKSLVFWLCIQSFLMRVVLVTIFFLFRKPLIHLLIHEAQMTLVNRLFIWGLICQLLSFLTVIAQALIILRKDSKSFFWIQVANICFASLVRLVAVVGFKYKAMGIVAGNVADLVFQFGISLWYLRDKFSVVWNKRIFSEIYHIGTPAMLKTPCSYFLQNTDRFIVQYFLSAATLGLYSHGLSYMSFYNIFEKAFNRVYGSYFFKTYATGFDRTRHERIGDIWVTIHFIMVVAVVLFINNFLDVFTHGKFVAAGIITQLAFFTIYIGSLSTFYSCFLVAERRTKYITGISLATAVIAVGANYLGVKYFGYVGGVFGLFIAAMSTWVLCRRVNQDYGHSFSVTLYLKLLAGLVVIFILRALMPTILALKTLVPVAVLYAGLLAFFWKRFDLKQVFWQAKQS